MSNSSVVNCTSVTTSSSIDASAMPVTRAAGSVPNELATTAPCASEGLGYVPVSAPPAVAPLIVAFVPFTPGGPCGPGAPRGPDGPTIKRQDRARELLVLAERQELAGLGRLRGLDAADLAGVVREERALDGHRRGIGRRRDRHDERDQRDDQGGRRTSSCGRAHACPPGGWRREGTSISQAASAVRLGPRLGLAAPRADGRPADADPRAPAAPAGRPRGSCGRPLRTRACRRPRCG